ncbi:MAG: DNA polymerase domain-containing protein [Terrimicrobiaceae bacterium]
MASEIPLSDILQGCGRAARIVAVEPCSDREVEVFRKEADGSLVVSREPLRPVIWVTESGPGAEALAGDLRLRSLITCGGWKEFTSLVRMLKESGRPYFAWTDPAQQYLATTGETLFKGMDFEDLRRLQIDIETTTAEGFDFSNPERDPLAGIALSDSTGWEVWLPVDVGDAASEAAVLTEAGRWITERDPDVIEGHNLFNFDLPFLMARARAHSIRLNWGRGGRMLTRRPSRLSIAERTIQFERFSIYGRHIVDTWILSQLYDVSARELESYGLKAVAAHLGVSEAGRIVLDGDELRRAGVEGDSRLEVYALQDVRETRAVAAALSRSYFFQAQIFPFTYQDVILRGNATRINSLFLREYLRRRHSIPLPPEAEPFEGGTTEIFETGILNEVWHCDAASLYPSIILAFDIRPKNDALSIFAGMLSELRAFRLSAKSRLRSASDPAERARLDALQGTFKILINSFYGYLGFAQGHLADFAAARDVAARGRSILGTMVDWLRGVGARVIEIDTDGIYFQPPPGKSPGELAEGMATELPEGIEVEFDKTYRAMFSYKAKNYALLDHEGHMITKGAALKSRGMEPFLREYLQKLIRALLEGRTAEAAGLKAHTMQELLGRRIAVAQLARTETLQDSPASYQRKVAGSSRNRSAAYELALASGRDYRAGDQIRYYITGTRKTVKVFEAARMLSDHNPAEPDENLAYYAAKLEELAGKFEVFLPRQDDLFG